MAVRWLVDNRRGGYWTSTKQTANVVEALMEYARAHNELTPDYTVTLDVDGKVQKTYHINRENALLFDNRFLVGDEILTSGGQQLHITMQGTGTLYYCAYMKFFDHVGADQGAKQRHCGRAQILPDQRITAEEKQRSKGSKEAKKTSR